MNSPSSATHDSCKAKEEKGESRGTAALRMPAAAFGTAEILKWVEHYIAVTVKKIAARCK
jgi:hypothetical protein